MTHQIDTISNTDTSTRALAQRLVRVYLSPHIYGVICGLLCMIAGAACTALLAKQMEPVIDEVFIARNINMLIGVAVQIFAIFMVKGLADYGQSVAMTHVGERIVADIRTHLIKHVLKADMSFFHTTPSGELISRFITDVNMLHRIISRTITCIGKDSLTLVFLVGLMFYKDWLLASLAFVAFPIALLPIIRIGKKIRKTSGTIQKNMASFTVLLSQVFQGARLIKAYGMEPREQTRAQELIQSIFKHVMKATKTRSVSHPIMEFLGGIAIVTVICYGGYQVILGNQTSGAFFTFITALFFSYAPLKRLAIDPHGTLW